MTVLTSLGAGSGLDSASIVKSLVAAQREPVQKALDARAERVEARLSALGQFRQALDALNQALAQRLADGAASPRAQVSAPDVLGLQLAPGLGLAPRTLEVRSVATAQLLASEPVAAPDSVPVAGSLVIRFGTVASGGPASGFTPGSRPDLTVSIGPERVGLAGLRDAINDAAASAAAPVAASLVTDSSGTRLVLRGTEGEANGFVVQTSDTALDAFSFSASGGGLARTTPAADADLRLDGLPVRRASNQVDDLIPGARLTLLKAAPGTLVTVSASRDVATLSQTVRDVAAALSELVGVGRDLTRSARDGLSAGALVADGTARRAVAGLASLTTQPLLAASGNAPVSLAGLGVTTARDGSIGVNEGLLARAVTDHPAAVESILSALAEPPGFTRAGSPLFQMAGRLREAAQGRAGQPGALQREAQEIARARALLDSRMARTEASLTRQFTLLDTRVGETRAIESALKLQIDLWRNARN